MALLTVQCPIVTTEIESTSARALWRRSADKRSSRIERTLTIGRASGIKDQRYNVCADILVPLVGSDDEQPFRRGASRADRDAT